MMSVVKEQFWKVVLLICIFVTCIGLFNGDWELILPTLWGIWVYKKEIDEMFSPTVFSEDGDEDFEVEERYSTTSKIIYTICHHYAQGLTIEQYQKFMDETYFFCVNLFAVASVTRNNCHWCGNHTIMFEYCEDLEGHENDLVCTRCMTDYIIGVCESECDKL